MEDVPQKRIPRVLQKLDRVMLLVAVLAIFLLLVEWGWGATLSAPAQRTVLFLTAATVAFFLFETFAKLALAQSLWGHVRGNLFEFALTAVFLGVLVFARQIFETGPVSRFFEGWRVDLSGFYLVVGQAYLVASVLMKVIAFQKHLSMAGIQPAAVVVGSFAFAILIGMVLLASPHAVAQEELAEGARTSLVDALFTATSAVCVTGLIVKDTGGYFSPFGQGVILVLIQIGGLGLMTFVTFSSLVIGKGLALRERVVMQDVLSHDVMATLPRLVFYILIVTFVSEAIGAGLLYPVWEGDISGARRLYLSAFHAVSAFCNAGFCLYSDSFVRYRGSLLLNGVVTALIVFGGLGFLVQRNLIARSWRALSRRWVARRLRPQRPEAGRPPVFFRLQTRVVLLTTAVLLAAGGVVFAVLEWNGALGGMPLKDKLLAGWFQTVTPRTAGFNTVSFSNMRTPTYIVTVFLMFIGASPGSTGGGIKTSTFAILLATIYSSLRNRGNVELMNRTVPYRTVRQAVMVVVLALFLVLAGVFVLTLAERGVAFERLLFEEMSAFGTVGLSPGSPGSPLSLSASLSWVGKVVIIVTMFAGRIGPLTLVVAIAQKRQSVDYDYPSEQVVIG